MVFFKLLPLFSFSFVFDTATFSEQFYKASLPLLQCLIRLACSPREWQFFPSPCKSFTSSAWS